MFYAMQVTLYGTLNNNVNIINYSSSRLEYLIDINLQITTMMLVTNTTLQKIANPNLPYNYYTLYGSNSTLQATFTAAESQLNAEATNLKNAQTELSLRVLVFPAVLLRKLIQAM